MNAGVWISHLASGYLAVLSAYHVWTGAISFFAPDFALRFYRGFYGCDPVERRHLRLVLRPWGALAIFAGLVGGIAFVAPSARFWIMSALAVLLALRIGYRLALRRDLAELAHIAPRRNLASTLLLAGGALLLTAEVAGHLFSP
jgi:hypothetical protein